MTAHIIDLAAERDRRSPQPPQPITVVELEVFDDAELEELLGALCQKLNASDAS